MNGKPNGGTALPAPGFGGDCVISRHDLEVLLRGAESEREIGYRNLFAGIATSCGLGMLGMIASHFGEPVSVGADPVESILIILLTAVTLASSALAIFFHRRLQVDSSRGACRKLNRHIREQLEHPAEPDDPRRWP